MEKPATSFGQERLWFLRQLEPASGVYNVVQALHLQGELDLQALSAALDGVIARHETLRTSFRNDEGIPAPVAAEKWSLQIALTDLRSQGLAVKGEALEAFVKQDACRPFDLSRDLMLRASLLRYSDV